MKFNMHLTPDEAEQVKRVHCLFDEYLRRHLVEDLKTFASLHAPWLVIAAAGALVTFTLFVRWLTGSL